MKHTTKYDLGWRDSLRMKQGIYWRKPHPTWEDVAETVINWLFFALVLAAILFLAGYLDARDAKVAAQVEATESAKQFAEFLNGGTLTDQTGHFAAKCESLVQVTN